ncbi:MAG: hypothetical protein EAX86_05635 [Candidatus Heimdallarchaeota archaeon]|nr:hypothetical protein [Candidatus Heimdallarchaeota archaeon]
MISYSIGYIIYYLNTTRISNGEINLIIEANDGYKQRNDSIKVNADPILHNGTFFHLFQHETPRNLSVLPLTVHKFFSKLIF